MNTDEAWEKFKLNDSDRIGKSSTAAMLETILAQQNAINAKVDQILDENKGAPAEDMEEESADVPPMPPMGEGGAPPAPDMGGMPVPEGEAPPDAGANPADSMPPIDENALLGGAPQDLNGGVPEPAPDMGAGMPGAEDEGDDEDDGGLGALLGMGGGQGMGDSPPIDYSQFASQGQDYDDNVSAITDAITGADDVDVQLGMTQVLQDYLSKKKGEGSMLMPDMSAPEGENPMEAIVDAIAGGAPEGDVPPVGEDVPPEGDGAGIEEIMDALGGGEAPVEGDVVSPMPEGSPEGDEGMADILGTIAGEGEGAPLGEEAPADVPEEEEEPVKKSFGDKDKDDDDKESEKDSDEKDDEAKDDKKDDDKKESKKKYPWDEYLDEDEADPKEEKSKDDDKDDDKEGSKEDDMPEDEADAIIAIDEDPISDVDTAAIEEVIGKKMSDLIMALRDILGDDADTDINPMIAHGAVDLGPNTDPFMACGDSPEAMETLTRSIDSLIEDRMKGLRGNDGKMYKVIKSEAQLRDERTDKLKRSLSSNAVYHMTGREVLDAMKGLEDNGVEGVKKSFVNPYDVIVRSLDCAVGQEVTDKYLGAEGPTAGFRKAKGFSSKVEPSNYGDITGAFAGTDDESKINATLLRIFLDRADKLEKLKSERMLYPGAGNGDLSPELRQRMMDAENALASYGFAQDREHSSGYPVRVIEHALKRMEKTGEKKLKPETIRGIIQEAYKNDYWPEYGDNLNELIGAHDLLSQRGFQMDDIPMFAKVWQSIGNTVYKANSKNFWRNVADLGDVIDHIKKYYGTNFDDDNNSEFDLYDLLARFYFRMPRTKDDLIDKKGKKRYPKYTDMDDAALALTLKAPNIHTKQLMEALKALNEDQRGLGLPNEEGSVPLPFFLTQMIDSALAGQSRGFTDIFKEAGYPGRNEAYMLDLVKDFDSSDSKFKNVNNFSTFANALNNEDISPIGTNPTNTTSSSSRFGPRNSPPNPTPTDAGASDAQETPVEEVKEGKQDASKNKDETGDAHETPVEEVKESKQNTAEGFANNIFNAFQNRNKRK